MPTDIGEMQVGLSLDESSFTQSMNSLERSIDELTGKFDSLNADTTRTEKGLSKLSKSFAILGTIGTTALIGIAKNAPATAGAMASMEVSAFRLKNAVGEALSDEFDTFANILTKFTDWVEDNPDTFSSLIKGITGVGLAFAGWKVISGIVIGVTSAVNGLTKAWSFIKGSFLGRMFSGITNFFTGGAGQVGAGIGGAMSVAGTTAAIGALPLINTYQREIGGGPGFLDKQIQAYNQYQKDQDIEYYAMGSPGVIIV